MSTVTKFSEKKSREILNQISTNEPNTLRSEVAGEALNRECISSFFQDLLQHGCICGMIPKLVYYVDTHKFYDLHYNEIEHLRQDYEDNCCVPLLINDDLKNFLAWFSFEETAYQMVEEVIGVPF